jgi:ribosomal RNA-processing protein 9
MKRRVASESVIASDGESSDAGGDDDLSSLATGVSKSHPTKKAASTAARRAAAADADLAQEETPDEKRMRLARLYLEKLGVDVDAPDSDDEDKDAGVTGDSSDEFGTDKIGNELRRRALRAQGKEPRRAIVPSMLARAAKLAAVAPAAAAAAAGPTALPPRPLSQTAPKSVPAPTSSSARPFGHFPSLFTSTDVRVMRGHRLPPTCLALEEDDSTVYSASKDSTILRFDVETGARTLFSAGARVAGANRGHTGEILALSLSSDGVYLASGGRDKTVRIWDTRSQEVVETFREHRDAVSAVAFRRDSLALYTGSYDRCVNVYNIEQMAYVEPLYGHQSPVTALSALYQERAYSAGEDRTMRVWKIPQESQLLFRAPPAAVSLDAIAAVAPSTVLTGSQDGSLALWSTDKKRPQDSARGAHGGSWISAVAALYPTDLVASGSSDGYVRFWQTGLKNSTLTPAFAVPVTGWVNGLAIGRRARFAVAAVGQEHRLGRWDRVQEARCGVHVLDLSKVAGSAGVRGDRVASADADDDEDDEEDNSDNDAAEAALRRGRATARTAPKAAAASGKKGNAAAAADSDDDDDDDDEEEDAGAAGDDEDADEQDDGFGVEVDED